MIDLDQTPGPHRCGCICSNPRKNFENDDASYPVKQCANGLGPIASFFRSHCTTPGDPTMSFENDLHDENRWLLHCYCRTILSFEKTRELEPSTQDEGSMEGDTLHCRRPSTIMERRCLPVAVGMWMVERRKYQAVGRCGIWIEPIERNRWIRMKNWCRLRNWWTMKVALPLGLECLEQKGIHKTTHRHSWIDPSLRIASTA